MDYKSTLNLPKTEFPMKANLREAEPRMLAWWDEVGIYKRLRVVAADRPLWILHDGPPYANGNIHMGHVLNKVMKDLVVKSRSMLGFNAVYVPGWDCHGLPIEHQVDKELGLDTASVDVRRAMDPLEKIGKCRAYAARYIEVQRDAVSLYEGEAANGVNPALRDFAERELPKARDQLARALALYK